LALELWLAKDDGKSFDISLICGGVLHLLPCNLGGSVPSGTE
jgi:hypothetical protein